MCDDVDRRSDVFLLFIPFFNGLFYLCDRFEASDGWFPAGFFCAVVETNWGGEPAGSKPTFPNVKRVQTLWNISVSMISGLHFWPSCSPVVVSQLQRSWSYDGCHEAQRWLNTGRAQKFCSSLKSLLFKWSLVEAAADWMTAVTDRM